MAASAWVTYDDFQELLGDNHGGLDSLTLNIALFTSASNANTGTLALLASVTNQVANGAGYTTGGAAVANVTWSEAAGTATLDGDAVVWTAAGGSITARFAVLYAVGTVGGRVNPLIARCILDDTPADVTATDGNTLTITPHANGFLTLARAA